ncbi:Protein BZZ1 [Coniothyrium glycines]
MRLCSIAIVAAVAATTSANPHLRAHHHAHPIVKRDSRPDNVIYAPAATETRIVYMLDGYHITEEDVRQGIANGTLEWADDGTLSSSSAGPVALPTTAPEPISEEAAPESSSPALSTPDTKNPPVDTTTSPTSKPEPAQPIDDTLPKTWADLIDKDGNCPSCNKEFPNGKLPCNHFPFGYGALPLDNEGLGGWSGIQDPQYRGADGFDDITTVVKGSCSDGSCCSAGTFCSYGCPNPYLKNSFPKKQGRTGQSVGGLYCNNDGFLEMADGSTGKTLCGQGSKSVTVKVHNRLKQSVSICRTDYPGTESMTFPLTVGPGETGYLANPDQEKYFFWQGKATSAHYYVNKQGVPESEACTWGQEMSGKGNWSPAIIGTSFDDRIMQEGFSSLKQNELCKEEKLDYDVTFMGDGIVSPCSYKHSTNQYCQGDDCWTDKTRGCTAAAKAGSTLFIVLSDD